MTHPGGQAFSDEDLKRLKGKIVRSPMGSVFMQHNEWRTLIARLEAAERIVNECRFHHCIAIDDPMENDFTKWRKAAGK